MSDQVQVGDEVIILKPEAIEARGKVLKVTDKDVYVQTPGHTTWRTFSKLRTLVRFHRD